MLYIPLLIELNMLNALKLLYSRCINWAGTAFSSSSERLDEGTID